MTYYETTDLSLTAYLSLKFIIEKIDKVDPRRVRFFFKDSKKLQQDVSNFLNKKSEVDPLAYFNAIKEVKNRIYNVN